MRVAAAITLILVTLVLVYLTAFLYCKWGCGCGLVNLFHTVLGWPPEVPAPGCTCGSCTSALSTPPALAYAEGAFSWEQ